MAAAAMAAAGRGDMVAARPRVQVVGAMVYNFLSIDIVI